MDFSYFKNKRICITGGTGSIGSSLVELLLNYNPKVIRIISNDEYGTYLAKQQWGDKGVVRPLLGDIRDKARLTKAFKDIDIVFHAAAFKHVDLCEFNPFEAIETNVNGINNAIEAALVNNVEKFIAISTDKASAPTNVMGATKLLGERLVCAAELWKGNSRTVFANVRFGNVLGSRGSILPLIADRIKNKNEVTITEPSMTRFFMTLTQACNLVLMATMESKGGEIFVLKMPTVTTGVTIESIIKVTCKKLGLDPAKVKRTNIGIRPGEKIHEDLLSQEESRYSVEKEKYFIIYPWWQENIEFNNLNQYSSNQQQPVSEAEYIKILETLKGDPLHGFSMNE